MIDFDIVLPEMPSWMENVEVPIQKKVERLPDRSRYLLYSLGDEGFNNNLLAVAMSLKNHLRADETASLLKECGENHCFGKRDFKAEEVARVIRKAYSENYLTDEKSVKKWPLLNKEAVSQIVKNSPVKDLEGLQELYGLESTETGTILDKLFGKESLVCMGKSQTSVKTQKLSKWGDQIDRLQFLVPSPMSRLQGLNKEGKISSRCLDNTGNRKFLVVEFDHLKVSDQYAIIHHLASIAPLVMVLHSGGKSLHAWFVCRDLKEEGLFEFMQYAVSLGADRALWTRCQLARTPGVERDNGKLQEVLAFRPSDVMLDVWNLDLIPEKEKKRKLPPIYSADELTIQFSTPPTPVIENVIGVGEKMMLSASSKAGKTWAMLLLAKAVAEGLKWFNFQCRQGRVLFLNFELSEARLAQRIDLVTSKEGMSGVDFMSFRGKVVDFTLLEEELNRIQGKYALIIIDPVYKLLGDINENDNGEVAQLLHRIERLAVEASAAVAYSHHFSKGNKGKTDQIDRASGAGAWSRDPDALLSLTPHSTDHHYVMEATLRSFAAPEPSVWKLDFPHFTECKEADASLLKGSGGANKKGSAQSVVSLLAEHPDGIAKSELRALLEESLGVGRAAAYNYIKSAEDLGLIEQNKNGDLCLSLNEDDDIM